MYANLLGSRIIRQKEFGFQHPGTCATVDCSWVVDSMPNSGARLVPFLAYAQGQSVTLQSRPLDRNDAAARASRALSLVGRTPYDLVTANCDHVAGYAETGVAASPQVALVVGVLLVGGAIWALSRN